MEKIISFKDFSFQYTAQKNPTLKNINLDIYRGEKILICGPSGSGKSTLSNCINGLIPYSYSGKVDGSLIVDGVDTSKSSIFELSNHVGTVLQDTDSQFISLTVAEDIAFSLENNCYDNEEMEKIVERVSKEVGIDDHLKSAPSELSGGQKQRVSLAGVMVGQADILLFDEPLANLDPKTGKSAIELIDKIQKNSGCTVIIIEHRLEDVLWCHVDRVILMNDGVITCDEDPNALLSSDVLVKSGIREPLYITCLKYAGVDITCAKLPEHIDSLLLDQRDIEIVNKWYKETKFDIDKNRNNSILKIDNLSFRYAHNDHDTLHNISFDVRRGEMLSIVGQNGAGKSTLAKIICGFENSDRGHIYFDGKDISRESIRERAKDIGYVMQNPNQMISQSLIFDEVALGIRNIGLSDDEIKNKVYDVLKICGLYEFRNWPISALSYGQRKRVTIASILVMGPKVIILDEPTAGQDFKHYTEIMEFLKTINKNGVTVIMITHDMHLMLEYTSRGIVIVDGKILSDKSSSEILCDSNLVKEAALKETSLFTLANKCHIEDPVSFVDCFINYDRKVREDGC